MGLSQMQIVNGESAHEVPAHLATSLTNHVLNGAQLTDVEQEFVDRTGASPNQTRLSVEISMFSNAEIDANDPLASVVSFCDIEKGKVSPDMSVVFTLNDQPNIAFSEMNQQQCAAQTLLNEVNPQALANAMAPSIVAQKTTKNTSDPKRGIIESDSLGEVFLVRDPALDPSVEAKINDVEEPAKAQKVVLKTIIDHALVNDHETILMPQAAIKGINQALVNYWAKQYLQELEYSAEQPPLKLIFVQ